MADEVNDKERANFCGYFTARPGAYAPGNERAARARRRRPSTRSSALRRRATVRTLGTAARRELEELFRPREPDGRGRS